MAKNKKTTGTRQASSKCRKIEVKKSNHINPMKKKSTKVLHKKKHQTSNSSSLHKTTKFHPLHNKVNKPAYYIPTGIRLLSGYLLFIGALYLISFLFGIKFPTTIVLGALIQGTSALFLNLLIVIVLSTIIYGFLKRKRWCFDLALIWFGLGILNSLFSVFAFPRTVLPVVGNIMLLSFVSTLIINTVIIWYILHEKKYFYARTFRDSPWQHRDKVLVYTLVTFWAFIILLGVIMGINFVQDTLGSVDNSISDLSGLSSLDRFELCSSMDGNNKDICFVVAAAQEPPSRISEISAYCENIKSDFYKFTCLQTMR